jgi:iron-sulfur cluster assembly accessory protein
LSPTIQLTPRAAAALRELLSEEGASGFGLRIQVVGGGCAGFSYDLALANHPEPEDDSTEVDGVKLFVDRRARSLLDGLTLDYQDSFRFTNPNAKTTCRCGVSFGV